VWTKQETAWIQNRGAAIEPTTTHDSNDHREDFAEFCGAWSEADAAEFDENTKDFREIDPRDWQ
jgi:hypothetical protein